MSQSTYTDILAKLDKTGKHIVFQPPTKQVVQAILVADAPYDLMDPGDYTELCIVIQAATTLGYDHNEIENALSEWEATDGPHFDEPDGKPRFTDHMLAILCL